MHIRPATPSDYVAFIALWPELRVDDLRPTPQAWETRIAPSTSIAVDGDDVVGYCQCQVYADSGYVRQIVVAPQARRRGIGRALMETAARQLREQGKLSWRLNVRPDNHAAVRLYGSLGFATVYSSVVLRLPWSSVEMMPAGDGIIRALGPERDRELETLFDLPAGQIAFFRLQGRTLLEAVDGTSEEVTGLAVFNPDLPGAFPFRVRRPGAVEPLLRALSSHGRPQHSYTAIAIEGDPALAERLVRAGAEIRDEVLHMVGSL
jgi:GNAT superfamily N-acetyltransferase